MLHTQTSLIDAFLALFKLLPTEAQQEIKKELFVEKASVAPWLKRKFRPACKLSSLEGKVSKMSAEEIDKQIKQLRSEWERNV